MCVPVTESKGRVVEGNRKEGDRERKKKTTGQLRLYR